MGGAYRKNRNLDIQTEMNDEIPSCSVGIQHSLEKSQQKFYKEFKNELNKENMHELQVLFTMINVTINDTTKTLFKYANMRDFRKIFQKELEKYYFNLEISKNTELIISDRLKNHCLGVISTHIEILENIYDPSAIENILDETANSHSFVSNISTNFKLHDDLLKKCLKEEFGRYMNRNTIKSLQKYIKLVHKRLQFLTHHWSIKSDSGSAKEAMQRQKKIIKRGSNRLNSIREIYTNPHSPATSERWNSTVSETSVYPATSTEVLDKIIDE